MTDLMRTATSDKEIIYPDSDGKPMADNTLQFKWIVVIESGLETLFDDNPNVFVAGNLLWYPVEGNLDIAYAPDAMVVIGRPKGYRGSYKQWEEDNIAPQVVFEIWSPSNNGPEMQGKRLVYEQYGVEEYYEYNPYTIKLKGWIRRNSRFEQIIPIIGWVSPLLGIRFEIGDELEIYYPDGRPFVTPTESEKRAERERIAKEQAQAELEWERQRAKQEQMRAEQAEQRAEQERIAKEQERIAKEQAQAARERAWAKLKELGIENPEAL